MTVGVGLFGTFTAWIASWFVDENTVDKKDEQAAGSPLPPKEETQVE